MDQNFPNPQNLFHSKNPAQNFDPLTKSTYQTTLGTMSSQLDKLVDPSVADRPILSRGQLQELEEDPSKMEVVARLMGAVNLDNLFRFMQNPTINPATRIEFQKLLNKMGRLEPETTSGTQAGPQVVINITRAKDNTDTVFIEGISETLANEA